MSEDAKVIITMTIGVIAVLLSMVGCEVVTGPENKKTYASIQIECIKAGMQWDARTQECRK